MEWNSGFQLYEGDLTDAIAIVEHYATQQCYRNSQIEFWGPIFKPENNYMTSDGYPLGTTCWYVRITIDGRFRKAFGKTFREAAIAAHELLVQELNPCQQA